jgi:hypothetical protein
MLNRVITLIVIAAIIACPMWCASGLVSCCATGETQSDQVETAGCCCRHNSLGETNKPASDNHPKSPEKSCQGVCGGAVLEKPAQWNHGQDREFLLPLVCETSVADALMGSPSQPAACDSLAGGNLGHFLRKLHMSFLC